MATIATLRNQILENLSECLKQQDFNAEHQPTFYMYQPNVVQVVHIEFLSRRHAAYFTSNTASFSLRVGVYFNIAHLADPVPQEFECHLRGVLLRDFRQQSPLQHVSWFHPDKRRRDIWWVARDGSNIDTIIHRAARVIQSSARRWLDTYSNIPFVLQYLHRKREKDSWKGGPFGCGAIGSPLRTQLIEQLEEMISHHQGTTES